MTTRAKAEGPTPQPDSGAQPPIGGPDRLRVAAFYDRRMYQEAFVAYYGQTDYANFGYWEAGTSDQKHASEALTERLLDLVPRRTGRILDVACGKGATTKHLLRHYAPGNIAGINISARQLASCQANAPGCAFFLMDAPALGFHSGSFETVLCVEAAFHFTTRQDFLREAFRVLKPGGQLVLSDILMTREAERRRRRTEGNYVPGPAEYAAMLRAAGYEAVRVIDATEQCWKACYRSAVRHVHELFLAHAIPREEISTLLDGIYGQAPDITYYLLAAARKPDSGGPTHQGDA
jgi:MPBQ/MSBQ methyltransferase